MTQLYNCNAICIEHDGNIMYCTWQGHQDLTTIPDCAKMMLQLVHKYSVKKILNDNRRVEGPWHDSAAWIHDEWFPSVFETGLEKFAWVLSPDSFAQVSTLRAAPISEKVKTFLLTADALHWLNTP